MKNKNRMTEAEKQRRANYPKKYLVLGQMNSDLDYLADEKEDKQNEDYETDDSILPSDKESSN